LPLNNNYALTLFQCLFEYGGLVWDNCDKEESDLIESILLETARIITGLRKVT